MSVEAISAQNMTLGITHTGGLTPDGLVLYLESQLGDIDSKIQTFMVKQEKIQEHRKELNVLAGALATVAVPEGQSTAAMEATQAANFHAALAALKTQGFDTKGLDEFAEKLDVLTAADYKSLETTIKNKIQELESSASLDMIQLQSCVQQRNTCISLATNLMSAVGKGEEAIAGNIGR
jgi:hypothetical protein